MIIEHFGIKPGSWSCVACWEQGNDTSKTVQLTKLNKWGHALAEYEERDLKLARECHPNIINGYGGPKLLMTLMCRDGVLEEGEYLVDISW